MAVSVDLPFLAPICSLGNIPCSSARPWRYRAVTASQIFPSVFNKAIGRQDLAFVYLSFLGFLCTTVLAIRKGLGTCCQSQLDWTSNCRASISGGPIALRKPAGMVSGPAAFQIEQVSHGNNLFIRLAKTFIVSSAYMLSAYTLPSLKSST